MQVPRDQLLNNLLKVCESARTGGGTHEAEPERPSHADGRKRVLIVGTREKMTASSSPIIPLIREWLGLNPSAGKDSVCLASWNLLKSFLLEPSLPGDMVAAQLLPRPLCTKAVAAADGLLGVDRNLGIESGTDSSDVKIRFSKGRSVILDFSELPFDGLASGEPLVQRKWVRRRGVDAETKEPLWTVNQVLIGSGLGQLRSPYPTTSSYLPVMDRVHDESDSPWYLNHMTLAVLLFQKPEYRRGRLRDSWAYEFSLDWAWNINRLKNSTLGEARASEWFRLSPLCKPLAGS